MHHTPNTTHHTHATPRASLAAYLWFIACIFFAASVLMALQMLGVLPEPVIAALPGCMQLKPVVSFSFQKKSDASDK